MIRSLKAGGKNKVLHPFSNKSPVSTFSQRAVLVRYLAYLDARPRKPSSAQNGDVEGGGGGGLPCIFFNVNCAYSTGGRVCQVAAEGGPPPRAGATAPPTCAYSPPTVLASGQVCQVATEDGPPPTTARATRAYLLPTRRRASMPSSGRGRPAPEAGIQERSYAADAESTN